MLSPKRDRIAATMFLGLARVISVDGHPAYASAVADLKQTGELGLSEQPHRAGPSVHQEADHGEPWIPIDRGCMQNDEGYEAMHAIRKGQCAGLLRAML